MLTTVDADDILRRDGEEERNGESRKKGPPMLENRIDFFSCKEVTN